MNISSISNGSCYRRDPYLLHHMAIISLIAYFRSLGNEKATERLEKMLRAEAANRSGSGGSCGS